MYVCVCIHVGSFACVNVNTVNVYETLEEVRRLEFEVKLIFHA